MKHGLWFGRLECLHPPALSRCLSPTPFLQIPPLLSEITKNSFVCFYCLVYYEGCRRCGERIRTKVGGRRKLENSHTLSGAGQGYSRRGKWIRVERFVSGRKKNCGRTTAKTPFFSFVLCSRILCSTRISTSELAPSPSPRSSLTHAQVHVCIGPRLHTTLPARGLGLLRRDRCI